MTEFVADRVHVGPYVLEIQRPATPDDLIDESRIATDEFMPYWAELWPAGIMVAEDVAGQDVRGLRVVELGCGLGIPSIVAALGGAQALGTDWAPAALALLRENGARNGVDVETLEVDWTQPAQLLERAPFDLAVCSDVLYEPRNVEALLDLLPRLAPEVVLGEPGRQTAGAFFLGAERDWEITRRGSLSVLRRR